MVLLVLLMKTVDVEAEWVSNGQYALKCGTSVKTSDGKLITNLQFGPINTTDYLMCTYKEAVFPYSQLRSALHHSGNQLRSS